MVPGVEPWAFASSAALSEIFGLGTLDMVRGLVIVRMALERVRDRFTAAAALG